LLVKNEVDWEALRLMKEVHLKELGFPMGPRLKIINSLKDQQPGNAGGVATPAAATPAPSTTPSTGNTSAV
jgi:hypothetical protein